MTAPQSRLFLVTPPDGEAAAVLSAALRAADTGEVASLLVSDGPAQAALAKALAGPAQAKGIAVLIEYDAELAMAVGADGVMTGGALNSWEAARAALSAGSIVGARCSTRHQAMELAEAGADFIAFADAGLVEWWGPLFQVPCVSLVPGYESEAADFARPPDAMWGGTDAP